MVSGVEYVFCLRIYGDNEDNEAEIERLKVKDAAVSSNGGCIRCGDAY